MILPAMIFWGFPWVGIVGVLLYLSGLGNIDQSVYEAAEIDGCGWFRKFWNIELPLITTQVRLNMVLMIIEDHQFKAICRKVISVTRSGLAVRS